MYQWILLFVILLIAGFLFLKLDHHKRRLFWMGIVIVVIVILISVLAFLRTQTIEVDTPIGTAKAVYSYVAWVGNTVTNLWEAKDEITDIVGDAIRLNSTSKRGELDDK